MSCTICNLECNETDRLRCRCGVCLSCHGSSPRVHCVFSRDAVFDPTRRIYTKKFNCTRLLGVEWEYSGYKNGKSTDIPAIVAWVVKHDAGHKPDGSCLAEIVTSPIGGTRVVNQLTTLGKLINSHTTVNNNCGIHVHVDARDINADAMDRLLTLYKKIEPIMYILGGITRANSTYCKPHMDNPSYTDRYRGMNLTNWRARNERKMTVEFRIQQGTTDTEHVVNWAKLCALVVDFAVKADMNKIVALKGSPVQILREIYPDGVAWMLKCLKKYRKDNKCRLRTISFNKENTMWKALVPKKLEAQAPREPCNCPSCRDALASRARPAAVAVPQSANTSYSYNGIRAAF